MVASQGVEILLVEDNKFDAELTMQALKQGNLANSIVWVKDGSQALDFILANGDFAGRPPDENPRVILLDLRLPKVDGLEVLREIKSRERTRSIPVVVLTSSQEETDIQECYQLGVNSFVSKPVDFEDFSKTVTELGMYWLLVNKPPAED